MPPQAISKRELGTGFAEDPDFYNLTARGLEARQSITGSNKPESVTFQLLLAIIAQLDGPAMLGPEKDIWDSAMRSPYPGLQTKFFIPFLNSWDCEFCIVFICCSSTDFFFQLSKNKVPKKSHTRSFAIQSFTTL